MRGKNEQHFQTLSILSKDSSVILLQLSRNALARTAGRREAASLPPLPLSVHLVSFQPVSAAHTQLWDTLNWFSIRFHLYKHSERTSSSWMWHSEWCYTTRIVQVSPSYKSQISFVVKLCFMNVSVIILFFLLFCYLFYYCVFHHRGAVGVATDGWLGMLSFFLFCTKHLKTNKTRWKQYYLLVMSN